MNTRTLGQPPSLTAITHPACRVAQAVEFWGKNFAKINAQAMFNEVDADHGDTISVQEWIEFWQNVVGQDCYSEEDVMEELESMMKVRPRRPRWPRWPHRPRAPSRACPAAWKPDSRTRCAMPTSFAGWQLGRLE